jgi:hypothetical protein
LLTGLGPRIKRQLHEWNFVAKQTLCYFFETKQASICLALN